jgi:DNA-binding response OmpR family regulator
MGRERLAEKLLILDDDVALSEMIAYRLKERGFSVAVAHDGREGLRMAYETHPDLVILDVNMPEMDGYEVSRRLREVTDVPILMVTARTGREDVLRGFEAGADDYIKKPIFFSELELRIQAILKRGGEKDQPQYDDGVLRIDLEKGRVFRRGVRVRLSPTELRLLGCLVREQGQVVSHAELLALVWGKNSLDAVETLAQYIRYLREKLEEDPAEPEYLRTEWGKGYWFRPGLPGGFTVTPPAAIRDAPGGGRR